MIVTVAGENAPDSALNRLVYNRDLAAVLTAGGLALAVYGLVIRRFAPGWPGFVAAAVVFGPLFWFMQAVVFVRRRTEIVLDPEADRIDVCVRGIWPRRSRSAPYSEWRYVRVDELEPPDTQDLKDIYAWQDLAEPGVHMKPAAVYAVVIVGVDGKDLIAIHETGVLDEALRLKKLLIEAKTESER